MLVRFTSAAGTITMFGGMAIELIKMLGASGRVPGAIRADDIGPAVLRLQRELAAGSGVSAPEANPNPGSESDAEAAIPLVTRAAPLLELLRRSDAVSSPVLWDLD